jgi:hypothetical protein
LLTHQKEFPNEFAQEHGIMDLDSDNPSNPPLTPTSPPLDKLHDPARMSVDEEDNKVNFSSGIREITPQEADSDSHQEQIISADDCTHYLMSLLSCSRSYETDSP